MICPKCGKKSWFDIVKCKNCGWQHQEEASLTQGASQDEKKVRCPYKDCNSKRATAIKCLPMFGDMSAYESWITHCPVCGRESMALSAEEIEKLEIEKLEKGDDKEFLIRIAAFFGAILCGLFSVIVFSKAETGSISGGEALLIFAAIFSGFAAFGLLGRAFTKKGG